MADWSYLEAMSHVDDHLDHDLETCGHCVFLRLQADVTREMLSRDDRDKLFELINEHVETVYERWKKTKFWNVWLS